MKIKALKYLISKNKVLFFKIFFKHPFLYSYRYLKSLLFLKKKIEDGATLFGITSLSELQSLICDNETTLLLAFSFCQKDLDCKATRFSANCLGDACNKCFISKYINQKNIYCVCVLTISDLGKKIFEIQKKEGDKLIFIITACDMAISMFEDLSNMLKLKGIALPLEGRVCSSFENFTSAENGSMSFQTIFSEKHKKLLVELLKERIK